MQILLQHMERIKVSWKKREYIWLCFGYIKNKGKMLSPGYVLKKWEKKRDKGEKKAERQREEDNLIQRDTKVVWRKAQ